MMDYISSNQRDNRVSQVIVVRLRIESGVVLTMRIIVVLRLRSRS